MHEFPVGVPLTQRIRDITVAEAISSAVGTDEAPDLLELSNSVQAVIPLQPRPPLAVSGYFPGTVAGVSAAVALNTSHVGIGNLQTGGNICRVNFIIIVNSSSGQVEVDIRRVEGLDDFTPTPAVPGYIPAGPTVAAGTFLGVRSNTVAVRGTLIGGPILLHGDSSLRIPGPWILNNGILAIAPITVNTTVRGVFGYEVWPVIRNQRPGG